MAGAGARSVRTEELIARTFDWFWKPVENLPDAERRDPSGETAYVNDLADKPVRDALNAVEAFLAHHRF